jgi:hypothetical protein
MKQSNYLIHLTTLEIFNKYKNEIIEKYLNGYTSKELGIEYNIARQTLAKLLKLENIKTRKKGEPTERQIKKMKNTNIERYGVINIGQLYHPNKGKKLSEHSLKIKRWTGKNNPNYGNKIGKNNGFKHGFREDVGFYFRSSWEANIARILNCLQIKWEFETTRYEINENETFIPDFYLPDKKYWIEVKGRWMEDARRKFDAFKNLYKVKVKVIDEPFYKWLIKRFKERIYLE